MSDRKGKWGVDTPDPAQTLGAARREVSVWQGRPSTDHEDCLAEEVAVALVYNGVSHVVMMATPADLEAFALGFSLTEGIIDKPSQCYGVEHVLRPEGIELSIEISGECFMRLKQKRRYLSGRTGCGLCGAESLQQVRVELPPVASSFAVSHEAITHATALMPQYQPLQGATGAVHGAAWCSQQGEIVTLCEDVGRHNALDKLIGRLWARDVLREPGFLLMSSRASYEILQKAAVAGIAVVVAVSAPTSLAVDIAHHAGITLVGFSREARHVAYSHGHRLDP